MFPKCKPIKGIVLRIKGLQRRMTFCTQNYKSVSLPGPHALQYKSLQVPILKMDQYLYIVAGGQRTYHKYVLHLFDRVRRSFMQTKTAC